MTEHDQTMALLLEQARADLGAARQRIAELESRLAHAEADADQAVGTLLNEQDVARERIAELEDWQRRAVAPLEMLVWLHEGSGATSAQEATARVLLSEVKP